MPSNRGRITKLSKRRKPPVTVAQLQALTSHDVMTVADVTSSVNSMHLAGTNEETTKYGGIDNLRSPEKELFELFVNYCPEDEKGAEDFYVNIMKDVVGSRKNALSVLQKSDLLFHIFFVNLTVDEYSKLWDVTEGNNKIRPIYSSYKPQYYDIWN